MVVVPLASLLSTAGILFLSLCITALPSLPSKLASKLTSSNSILTTNGFSAAQIWNSLSFALYYSSSSPCLQISLFTPPRPPPTSFSAMCVCVCLCFCHALYENVNFHMFCMLVHIDSYNYGYLCIVCFTLSCKVL